MKEVSETNRLLYRRLPSSWDGDPAPSRALLLAPLILDRPFGCPKGDRTAPEGGSMGDVLAVDEPDLGCVAEMRGRLLR